MGALQVSANTNGIKADLERGQGGIPGALTYSAHKVHYDPTKTSYL